MPTSLIDMPDVVMNKILEELDFRAIMTLRKVNHALRDFIDVHKPDGKFTSLDVIVETNTVIVQYSDVFTDFGRFEYVGTDNGCQLEYQEKKTQMSGIFYEQMLKDLKFIFEFQKLCLDSLEIEGKRMCEEGIYNKFLDGLAEILEPLSLEVTRLDIESTNPLPILKSLDAKILKSLYIREIAEEDDDIEDDEIINQIDIGDIKNLEVWSNLETVRIRRLSILNGKIQDFLKFKHVLVMFDTVTDKMLKDILEAFLTSPIIETFRLDYINLDDDLECFGKPFIREGQEDDQTWYFEIPESTKVVWISHSTEDQNFEFFRIERRMVPAEATVQSFKF